MFKFINNFIMKMSFKQNKRLQLYRILNKTTDEKRRGLKVLNVLGSLKKQEKKHSAMYKIYSLWIKQLNNGFRFSEVIKDYVPAAEAMLISANEKAGKISDGFKMALDLANQKKQFTNIVIQALTMPAILFTMGIIVLSYFCSSIIPSLSNTVPLDKMSNLSLFVLHTSSSFGVWMPMFLISCGAIVMFTIWALPNYKAGFRIKLDNLPPFSIYRIVVGISFLHTLSALVKARLKQTDALIEMKRFAPPYLNYRIDKYLQQINRGTPLGGALISTKLNFPDKEIIKELSMYAESGNIDEAMNEVIASLSEDGIELITKQAAILKSISIAWIVGLIGFLSLSLFTFMIDLQSMLNL